MTDRICAFTVVIENDIREDDAEVLASAIKMLKGVVEVSMNVTDVNQYIAESRVRADMGRKVLDVIYPEKKQ